MKTSRFFLSLLMCMFLVGNAFALTPKEKAAQTALRKYLQDNNVNSKIDSRDNSVNFQYKSKLFWVTFQENSKGVLYTLHRSPIKMESEKQSREKNARRNEIAIVASNYMNAGNDYKAYVSDNRVEFVFPVFAATPEDYTKVFMNILMSMDNVQDDFDRNYTRAKMFTDSVHRYWSNNDTSVIIVPQNNTQFVSSNNLTISKVDFRIVDAQGKAISNYGESIRKSEIRFIQPQITVEASKKGMYHIGVEIKTPDGKKLLPSKNTMRTILTTVEVDKKPKAIELGTFGSSNGSFWKAGEYKVTFFEDGNIIKTTTFTVL